MKNLFIAMIALVSVSAFANDAAHTAAPAPEAHADAPAADTHAAAPKKAKKKMKKEEKKEEHAAPAAH